MAVEMQETQSFQSNTLVGEYRLSVQFCVPYYALIGEGVWVYSKV